MELWNESLPVLVNTITGMEYEKQHKLKKYNDILESWNEHHHHHNDSTQNK